MMKEMPPMKTFQQIRERFLADARRYLFSVFGFTETSPALAVVRIGESRKAGAARRSSRHYGF